MKINSFAAYSVLITSALVLSPSRLGVNAGTVRGVHKTIGEDRAVQPEPHMYSSENSSDDEQYESNTEEVDERKLKLVRLCILPFDYKNKWRKCNNRCSYRWHVCFWYEWNSKSYCDAREIKCAEDCGPDPEEYLIHYNDLC